MKRFIKCTILVAVIFLISIIMPIFMGNVKYSKADDKAIWYSRENGDSKAADFNVLEIVPYKGMAEIGYLVGGQEPVDKNLMDLNSQYDFGFLGDALKVYPSYTVKEVPASGTADVGWNLVKNITKMDGYFERSNSQTEAIYSKITGTHYVKTAKGSGSYQAELQPGIVLQDVAYDTGEAVHYNNVKAYFVYGKPSGVSLYSESIAYEPGSVTRVENNTGDYDYDCETERFLLNKGKGAYHVIFKQANNGSNLYYMKDDYEVVDDGTGDYSVSKYNINYTEKSGGNYNKVDNDTYFECINNGSERYRFVPAAVPSNVQDYQNVNGRIYVRNQKIVRTFEAKTKMEIVNNEWFKRYALGISTSMVNNYRVNVVTVTPEELNQADNQHFISDADMIYINSNYAHNQGYLKLYENYTAAGQGMASSQKYFQNVPKQDAELNFALHDISWQTTVNIFKKAAGIRCKKAAIVLDCIFYQQAISGNGAYRAMQKNVTNVSCNINNGGATMCNMAKLYIMVYQRNMIDFYNAFLNPDISTCLIKEVNSAVNHSGTTGSFIRPDSTNSSATADEAVYWNGNTFLPFGLNSEGKMVRYPENSFAQNGIYNPNIPDTTTGLNSNILNMNGTQIFGSDFIIPTYVPPSSLNEALIHLNSLNPDGTPVTANNITIGNLMNVITNDGRGFENTGGVAYPAGSSVEGPVIPGGNASDDASGSGTEESNYRNYKRVLNIEPTADFASSESEIHKLLKTYQVQIINMTSTQFNGITEDINTRYDMIYMGSGAGRFNHSGANTVFNDPGMNSGIYFSKGDLIYNTSAVQQQYCGNDISEQRKSDLANYLLTGYPIVLDSGLYQLNHIKTDTNIYSFIHDSKASHPNLMNLADYYSDASNLSFMGRLASGLGTTRPIISLIAPVLTESAAESYSYVNPDTNVITIQFGLIPKGNLPSSFKYNAYIYFDKNEDGIFDFAKKLDIGSGDGTSWEGISERGEKIYFYEFQYDMKNMNGIYQWKVIVRRSDNSQIRSAISGYVANTNKQDLNILQIRENASSYSLASAINDASSLISKYAGTNVLKDYNLHITTKTVEEFQEMYKKNRYDPSDIDATSKLKRYHLLILSNSSPISDAYGAMQDIKNEIATDLGVIFTKNAVNALNQDKFCDIPCFNNHCYTYNKINRSAVLFYNGSNQLYIYNNLSLLGNLSEDTVYNTNYLTKSNDGSITRYPYEINKAIKISDSSYSNDTVLDYTVNKPNRLIGWYCLSDTKSPAVRKAFAFGTSSDLYQGIYSSSPNDVRNNYYLFNNGLCYYSGIELNKADQYGYDDEVKLFINTIIAAYKSTGREAKVAPIISITNPLPIDHKINLASGDFDADNNFRLKFNIADSSSKMNLKILLDHINSSETWNSEIYEVNSVGDFSTPTDINNTSNVVDNKTYIVKIPKAKLKGTHTLTLSATNQQGCNAVTEVTIKFVQQPVVEIIKPVPYVTNSIQYIYADMDWAEDPPVEKMKDQKNDILIVFKVSKAESNVKLAVKDSAENFLTGSPGVSIHAVNSDNTEVGEQLNLNNAVAGVNNLYCLHLPMSLMKDKNSMAISIAATDNDSNEGNTSLTLLRRSLFPLE